MIVDRYKLIDWLIDWLIDRLSDGLIDWLIDRSIMRWIDWLIDWLIDYPMDWLIDWFLDQLIDWLIDWLIADCTSEPSRIRCCGRIRRIDDRLCSRGRKLSAPVVSVRYRSSWWTRWKQRWSNWKPQTCRKRQRRVFRSGHRISRKMPSLF